MGNSHTCYNCFYRSGEGTLCVKFNRWLDLPGMYLRGCGDWKVKNDGVEYPREFWEWFIRSTAMPSAIPSPDQLDRLLDIYNRFVASKGSDDVT